MLVANFVCLPFGAEQVMYSGLLEILEISLKTDECSDNAMRVVRVHQSIVAQTAKQWAETRYKTL